MVYSYIEEVYNGQSTYILPFKYIDKNDIYLYINNELKLSSNIVWISDYTVRLLITPSIGDIVRLQRVTPIDNPIIDYQAGEPLTESALDLANLQHLYIEQETRDSIVVTNLEDYYTSEEVDTLLSEAYAKADWSANPGEAGYISNKPLIPTLKTDSSIFELKADPVPDNTYLDNTGNYTNIVSDTAIDDAISAYFSAQSIFTWSNIEWEDTVWKQGAVSSTGSSTSAKADTLTTARDITLAGDVTGVTSFDGSTNVVINTEVDPTKHTHSLSDLSDYPGSYNKPADVATPGKFIAIEPSSPYGLPVLNANNLTDLDPANITGVSALGSKFLKQTGSWENINLSDVTGLGSAASLSTKDPIYSGDFGDFLHVPTVGAVVKYVNDAAISGTGFPGITGVNDGTITNGDSETIPTSNAVYDHVDSLLGTAAAKDFSTSITDGDNNLATVQSVYTFVNGAGTPGLGDAAIKDVDESIISSTSTNLPTTKAIIDYGDTNWGVGTEYSYNDIRAYHSDSDPDWTNALQTCITANKSVYIPSGVYTVSSTININNTSCSIIGEGIGSSIIRFTAGVDGFNIYQNVSDLGLTISNVDIQTQSSGTNVAISLNFGTSAIDRTSPRFNINNVACRGAVGASTNGWYRGLDIYDPIHGVIDGFHFEGYFSSMPSPVSDAGIRITANYGNTTLPAEINIMNTWVFYANYGIYIKDIEGVVISHSNLVAIGAGVYGTNTSSTYTYRPQISVADTHINAYRVGVQLINIAQSNIHSNLIYQRVDAAQNSVGVQFEHCSYSNIVNNTFVTNSASRDYNAVVLFSTSNRNKIEGNNFQSATTCIWIQDNTCTGNAIYDNTYEPSTITTELIDNGIGTIQTSGSTMTGSQIISAIDDSIGINWKTQKSAATIVSDINSQLGSTDWQSGNSCVSPWIDHGNHVKLSDGSDVAIFQNDPVTNLNNNSFQVFRNAAYSGGVTSTVRGGVYSKTITGPDTANFEWAVVGSVENNTSSSIHAEHVGVYAQGIKDSAYISSTWAGCTDMHCNAANPVKGSISLEVGIFGTGTDNNHNRFGIDVSCGSQISSGNTYCGIRIGNVNGNPARGQIHTGLKIQNNVGTAIDLTNLYNCTYGIMFGSNIGQHIYTNTRLKIYCDNGCGMQILGIPISNPHIEGALWNNGGNLMISAG